LPNLPIVILSHGLYGSPEFYYQIMANIASFGYFVIGISHTDASNGCLVSNWDKRILKPFFRLPHKTSDKDEWYIRDNQVKIRLADISLLLNKLQHWNKDNNHIFKGKLDLDKIIIAGHSFGGATAVRSLMSNLNVKGVICLDAWIFPILPFYEKIEEDKYNFLDTPVLFINAGKWENEDNYNQNSERLKFLYNAYSKKKWTVISIKGTGHHSFNDFPAWAPGIAKKRKLIFETSMYESYLLVSNLSISFLKYCLDNDKSFFERFNEESYPKLNKWE